MKIQHIKMETGERLPMLLLDNGVPDFWATLFVGKVLRSRAQNSIQNSLNVLRHLRAWEEYHQRDLSQDFRDGRMLTNSDIESIVDHCAYEVDDFQRWSSRNKQGSSPTRTVSVGNVLSLKAPAPLKTVQFDTHYNRLTTVANYIKFLAETACRVRTNKRELQAQIEQMHNVFLKKRPKSSRSKCRGPYEHIPATAFRHFMDIAHPDHVDNPFRGGKTGKASNVIEGGEARQRNYLLIALAYELGLRAGEILGLWVGDITFGPRPTISIVRRHNHPLDPRKKQEVAKTQERTLPLPSALATALNRYILEGRSRHSHADRHPILFVTSHPPWEGHPLSSKSFRKAFKLVGQVNTDQLGDITPHSLRHDRVCRYVDELESFNMKAKTSKSIKEITDGALERDLMYYFGWSNPKSAAPYLRRRTRLRVEEGMRQFQKDTFGSGS